MTPKGSILNLTTERTTPAQAERGVVEPSDKTTVANLLTFHYSPPTPGDIAERAKILAFYAQTQGHKRAMVGGPDCMLPAIVRELEALGIESMCSFSKVALNSEGVPVVYL